jgi:hypothetical protein
MISNEEVTIEQDVNLNITNDFYFSYSSLNKLLGNPRLFYKEYILGEKEIKTEKYLLEGAIIHNLLLEPEAFNDRFVTTPELPSPNSIKVINHIFDTYEQRLNLSQNLLHNESLDTKSSLADFEDEILECLELMNLHQKVGSDKRALKIIEPKSIEYFEHLKNSKEKIIVDSEVLAKCAASVEIIKQDKGIMSLLGQDDETSKKVFNELSITKDFSKLRPQKNDYNRFPFKGLKGIVDNIVIDEEKKEILINDFKTTSKSLDDFQNSIEYYKYSLQAAIYLTLVNTWCSEFIDNIEMYSIKFNFIVFDKYNYLYAFPVSDLSKLKWEQELIHALYTATYHKQNNNYNLPYKYMTGSVSL